jgi:hypothetical protein
MRGGGSWGLSLLLPLLGLLSLGLQPVRGPRKAWEQDEERSYCGHPMLISLICGVGHGVVSVNTMLSLHLYLLQ